MKVILLENIEKLGFKDEIVNVKNGYGRNFLIPTKKAVLATDSLIKDLNDKLNQQAKKDESLMKESNKLAENLKKLDIKIKAKVSSGKKLFGAITVKQFIDTLSKEGHELDKRFIKLPSIKETGKYTANIRLHRSVDLDLPFEIISE